MWCDANRQMVSGSPSSAQELVAEQPVPDVGRLVEDARAVVEPVHPDVVQQAARPHEVDVNRVDVNRVDVRREAGPGPAAELLGDGAHDHAVLVDEVKRTRRGRVLLVQGQDFLVGRNPHATA